MRDKGISREKDINWFSLLPFPLSLTVKAKPLRHAEEKPPFKAGSGLNGLVSGSLMHNAARAREKAGYVDGA